MAGKMIADLLVLPSALAMDLALGELPSRAHPVVGMGKLLSAGLAIAPAAGKTRQLLFGMGLVLLVAAACGAAAFFLLGWLREVNSVLYVVVAAALLKSCFSVRELGRAATRVKRSLYKNDLEGARSALSWLVSRDTGTLNAEEAAGAAVESVAENTCDSFVAPLFYFIFFGVAGAVVYRVSNTADAMAGYHGRYEYLGKFAARLDDVLNYIPARLTGLLIVASAYLSRLDGRMSWRIMWRDHGRTESPNADWPMAAMAGALGVRLEKRGLYRLGDADHALAPDFIEASVKIMAVAVLLWFAISLSGKGALLACTS